MNQKSNNRSIYAAFHAFNKFCWACKVQPLPRELTRGLAGKLEAAHIVGSAGRAHDLRALVMLCKTHHMLNEGETIRHDGQALPRLTLENMLWLKRRFCVLDVEFIRECRRKKNGIVVVPEPLPLEPIGCKLQSPF